MARKRLLTLIGVGFVLLGCVLAAFVWSPAFSAASACRNMMEHIEGYGPWRAQAPEPMAAAQASGAVLTYVDGINTASCYARQYGPVWIVVGVGQTMVGCGQGLGQECPRGTYGVIP